MPSTPREYLSKFAERMPDWLASYNQGERVDASDFLKSRTVFYPGAGGDGHPFTVFAASHAAHCFVYADYGMTKDLFLPVWRRIPLIGCVDIKLRCNKT